MTRRKQKWSIQVDQYPGKGERMYGPGTVVQSHPGTNLGRATITIPDTEVDEIFIAGFFHLEAMSSRDYWMTVGGLDINVRLDKNGRAERVIYRVEGEPGVEYVDDTPARSTQPCGCPIGQGHVCDPPFGSHT